MSEISVTLCRFGRNLRLVLRFEWLTLWPDRTPLSVNAQRRDIGLSFSNGTAPHQRGPGKKKTATRKGAETPALNCVRFL